GAGGMGGAGGGGGSGGSGGVPGAWCGPFPACDAAPPDPGPELDWNHVGSGITAALGSANHRGRDLFVNPGDPQWVIAKFAYGLSDDDLKDEQVDLYLLRDCGETWEPLGSSLTTEEDLDLTVEGVENSGGRVYFEIPADKALGPGRHRVHLVVRGDLSSTDVFIEVVPPGTPMFVSDVDGTLTGTETEEFSALLTGDLPTVHADAPEAFHLLASKGYRPMYMTARPEWLTGRTREFVEAYGFPPGIIHTTLSLTGAVGGSASTYKTEELAMLAERELLPAWAFGNTETDAEAYDNGGVMPLSQRVFYQFDDAAHGGRRIESYTELLEEIEALPSLCE
ncbi:MAG TPA: hypothetical protein VLS89_12375, partial [Candidatus Nanopelagicales bacterium]|nr:hypothetical protein [Candidatus Nanopelagicales bacterium]